MKNSIVLVGLLLSLGAYATATEPSWKASLRGFITEVAGEEWSVRLLGDAPKVAAEELQIPAIPEQIKKTTSVETYQKQTKDPTEFDRLPADRKRQFNYNFLEELFMVTRKSEPRDEDLSNWLNTLDQGGSREGIYQALVLDEVYSALENMDEGPSPRLVDFTLNFSQKFLNQTIRKESLEDLNLYSLKRILSDRGLNLMEHYETTDLDDLYRWYALYSAYLAQEYAPILKSKIRNEPSATYHYEWAKNMPIQHIKSEFIIKTHKVMNGLQLLQ